MTIDEGVIKISDWAKGDFKAHRRKVYCLEFNASGDRLATGSQDHSIKVWKTDDVSNVPRPEIDLTGHGDAISYLAWHPNHNDKLVSVATSEKSVRFWDQRTAKNTATLNTPGHNLYVAYSSDGNQLAVGSKEDIIAIVDVRKMQIEYKHTYKYQVNELDFSPDSQFFVQGTGNGEAEVYKFPEMKKVGALKGHTSAVLSLSYDRQGKYIATGGGDSMACLWDAKEGICLKTYYKMDNPVRSLDFSFDGRFLAMTGESNMVYVEDTETGESLGTVVLNSSPEDLAWHPKEHILAYPIEKLLSGEPASSFIEWRRLK